MTVNSKQARQRLPCGWAPNPPHSCHPEFYACMPKSITPATRTQWRDSDERVKQAGLYARDHLIEVAAVPDYTDLGDGFVAETCP